MNLEQQVREGLARIVVGSIGPVTSEELREQGITPDFEPVHPKMGFLLNEAASGEDCYSTRSAGRLPVSSPEVSASGRATEGLGGGECRGPAASANGQILAGLLKIRFVDLSIEPIGDPDLHRIHAVSTR